MTSIRDEEIPSLEIGDVIYECEGGMNIEVRLTSKPVEVPGSDGRRAWEWMAVNTQNGEPISYRLTERLSHYGPRLYRQPEYVRFNKGGPPTIPLLGGPDRALARATT